MKRAPLPEALRTPSLKKALHVLDVMNFTREEREAYDGKLNWLRIEASTLKKAEEEAEARGEARGEAKGERNKPLAMASACFAKGLDIQMTAALTGLTEEELQILLGQS